MSVKVGVRVRPFNSREKERESECIISMIQNQTKIKDELGQEKTFTFDHSFWSHDGFEATETGYLKAVDDRYADQQYVFNAVGKQILDNAWEGYHCCLFAYGQTGSGKSYSMVGYGVNKGIVPISCEEIFNRIKSNTDPDKSYEVQVSMLEIYNEKVQDLLVPAAKRPTHGLKVRESKVLGIFVEGLTKYPVQSYDEISKKMDEGYENRTIGSTLMNATSSRAHTIVTIEFKQLTMIAGKKSEKLSMINLVDLAGSERAGSTGATGDRLKEGCNINKSLLVLGNVINALADKAMGKKKDVLPPYRDSALTRILQNALGGNSKTVMICALSPASINYEETLSTLRYADRAKKIQNKAVVNESEHDKMVRLLKEENVDLKRMIEELQKKLMGQGGVAQDGDKQAFMDLKEQYDANQKVMEDMQKSFKDKVEEAKKNDQATLGEKVDINEPHLVVLNEDPQLSHKLRYSLKTLPVYVGRKHGNPTPQIILSGIGIKQNHAVFIQEGDNIVLKPNEKDAKEYIYINGKKIQNELGQVLQPKDRITFGTNTILVFMPKSDGKDIYEIDWELAQTELQTEIEKSNKLQKEENEKKRLEELAQVRQNYEEELKKKDEELQKIAEEYKEKLAQKAQNDERDKIMQERIIEEEKFKQKYQKVEAEKARKKREFEKREKEEQIKKEKTEKLQSYIHQSDKLENTLFNILRKLSKMKIIISELKRNINLDVDIETTSSDSSSQPIPKIMIRVENYEEGTVYYWPIETFHNRYDLIKDMFEKFTDDELDIQNIKKEEDPLWDEPKPSLLGCAYYKLDPVAYLMNNEFSLGIISNKGVTVGKLDVDIIPFDADGNEYDEVPDQVTELIGQSLNFKVCVYRCSDLPDNFCRNLYVEYKMILDNSYNKTKVYNTEENIQTKLEMNEHFEHYIEYLSKEDIDYLVKEKLQFSVYAYENVEKKGKLPQDSLLRNSVGTDLNAVNNNAPINVNIPMSMAAAGSNSSINNHKEEGKKKHEKKDFPNQSPYDPKGKKKGDCIIF